MSENELGTLLRSRRESVTPADVGLRGGDRRRTPGLRRSELATLAGVSVEYLTRLEQGRDRSPSLQVLNALADALRLAPDDRELLRHAAKSAGGEAMACVTAADPAASVRPTVRALLDRLDPSPALVVNQLTDILAHTAGYERLAASIGMLDVRPLNLARFVFTDERAEAAYQDWGRVADEHVANLRFHSRGDDPHVARLVEELSLVAGDRFDERWRAAPRPPRRTGTEVLVHPEAGELRLAYETLDLPDADNQRLIVYLPADAAAVDALDRINGRGMGRLRVVRVG